jgi:hypothetical protein
MTSPLKRRVVFAIIVVVTLLCVADEYPAIRFRGDARFSGGPIWGYTIRMRPIPIDKTGEYVFHLRGLPNEEMSLQLYAEGKSNSDREELTHLSITISAILLDHNGGIVCQATGMPGEGQNERMTGGNATFWHWNCVQMPFRSSESYTLTLRISGATPSTPHMYLDPTLEGGQPDLP